MRQVHNPYGGVNPLIDKMIGNAYDIVKYVAKYLREIRYVAENMDNIYNVAHGYTVTVHHFADGETSLSLDFPEGVSYDNIRDIKVIALRPGEMYFPSGDTFNYGVSSDQLEISASSMLSNATYQVTYLYTPSE